MADDIKLRDVSLTNTGAGPRSFFNHEGEQVILRRGESFEGKVSEAEFEGLSSDLTGSTGGGDNSFSQFDFPELDGLDKDQLLAVATREGLSTMAADATEDDIRTAIEESRAQNPDLVSDMRELTKSGTTRDDLLAIADKEGVSVETDDNKGQLALKIAQARAANA